MLGSKIHDTGKFDGANMAENGSQFHILFVEDDDVDIQSVQREIKKFDFPLKLDIAKNGIEALDKLYGTNGQEKIIPPHLILLDINMPKMGGIEFLQKLQSDSQFKHITVYLLTTAYTSHDKLAIKGLNVAGHIIKPLQYDDLMRLYWSLIKGDPQ